MSSSLTFYLEREGALKKVTFNGGPVPHDTKPLVFKFHTAHKNGTDRLGNTQTASRLSVSSIFMYCPTGTWLYSVPYRITTVQDLTIYAKRFVLVFNPWYTVAEAASTKSGNGTQSSQDIPTEIKNSASHDTDDLSSIGAGGVSTVHYGPKSLRIGHSRGSIVVNSTHGNSAEVLEKCWLI